MASVPDEAVGAVATDKAFRVLAVFVQPGNQIGCDADLKCAMFSVGEHVDVSRHKLIATGMDPRVKPEGDDWGGATHSASSRTAMHGRAGIHPPNVDLRGGAGGER